MLILLKFSQIRLLSPTYGLFVFDSTFTCIRNVRREFYEIQEAFHTILKAKEASLKSHARSLVPSRC
jgi:hypothetical protein